MTHTHALTLQAMPSKLTRDILACLLGSFVISLFAQVSIPLPFTPVPIATQPGVILLLSVLLGRKAAFSVLGFLAQGLMGLPVFAGGAAGIAVLLGPTGGYLVGYFAAAYFTGLIVEKMKERTFLNAAYAMTVGNLIIFLLGASWLSHFVGFQKALLLGVAPFLAGDVVKIVLSLRLLKTFKWVRQ